MTYLRSCRLSLSAISTPVTTNKKRAKQAGAFLAVVLAALTCFAQHKDQPQTGEERSSESSQAQAEPQSANVTIPAGTKIALVLTHPVQSRYVHRGDDIYAQTTSPVNAGNQVVIPAGTFVQGKVDKLDWNGGRARLVLQSLSITFPDGYVAPVSGPLTLQAEEGYALKDPGKNRAISAIALPGAGAGIGALIGHAAGSSDSSVTTTLPPGCVGGPPFCLSSTTPVFGTKGRDTAIGVAVGAAVGAVASLAMLFSSHHFFLDVWSPVNMVVPQPITLQQREVASAVQQAEQHPVVQPPIAPRPLLPRAHHPICLRRQCQARPARRS